MSAARLLVSVTLVACNEPAWPPKGYEQPKRSPVEPAGDAQAPGREAWVTTDAWVESLGDGRVESPADASVDASVDAPPPQPMYSATEALGDALASPLRHIGTGAWPGNFSIKGCAYHNDRVIVVDVYCTHREQPAFSVVVLSPTRGRLSIYAEADKPISTVTRAEYFAFRVEASPVADLPLDATFAQITAWDRSRLDRRVKDMDTYCHTEGKRCVDDQWLAGNEAFVTAPTDDWFKLNRELRKRAKKYAGAAEAPAKPR